MEVVFVSILVCVLPFVILFIIGHLIKTGRTKKMQAFADEAKLSFLNKRDNSYLSKLPNFSLFSKGRKKTVRNILSGQRDSFKISIFDYSYRENSDGESEQSCTYTVVFFEAEKISIPTFSLRPKRLIEFGKSKVVKIESSPTFSKRYLLQGDEAEAIINLFNPDILRLFEEEKGWYIESVDSKLLFYKSRYLAPKKLSPFLDKSHRIATMFFGI